MAASVTHLVIGEKVLLSSAYFPRSQALEGAFLGGCVLVDMHAFQPIDRRATHFIGRIEEDGKQAYQNSCSNFMNQLNSLLVHPWLELSQQDKAFIAGYLCHLAVDECWKKLGWQMFQKLGISRWEDFPVPGDVSLTAFDFLASQQSPWFENALEDIQSIQIPDIFTHVKVDFLIKQWEVIRDYVLSGAQPAAYVKMLRLAGKDEGEIVAAEKRHQLTFEKAIRWYQAEGIIDSFIEEAVEHSVSTLSNLLIP